jgi:hypothetical protein
VFFDAIWSCFCLPLSRACLQIVPIRISHLVSACVLLAVRQASLTRERRLSSSVTRECEEKGERSISEGHCPDTVHKRKKGMIMHAMEPEKTLAAVTWPDACTSRARILEKVHMRNARPRGACTCMCRVTSPPSPAMPGAHPQNDNHISWHRVAN